MEFDSKNIIYKSERTVKSYLDEDNNTETSKTQEIWVNKDERFFDYENSPKVSVFDVAAYILKRLGNITTMKLHKLLYYSQAWSLVWDEKPLFEEEIEAWANGPVIRSLFAYHKGHYNISNIDVGNPDLLTKEQKETIDSVLKYYGDKSSQWLIELTHLEEPWKKARKGGASDYMVEIS